LHYDVIYLQPGERVVHMIVNILLDKPYDLHL
jgi:hypothetical protein